MPAGKHLRIPSPVIWPSLRERLEDLPSLIRASLSELGVDMQLLALPEIDVATMETLDHYNRPAT